MAIANALQLKAARRYAGLFLL